MTEPTDEPLAIPEPDHRDPLGAALRKLRPIEEKVVRLSYGIGCQRAHSSEQIAQAFGIAPELVEGILEEAEQRLDSDGVPRQRLLEVGGRRAMGRHRCRARQ